VFTVRFVRQIQHIYDNTTTEFSPVGYLPANNRDIWAKVRQEAADVASSYLWHASRKDYALLHDSVRNRRVLDALETCAFVVSLDSEKPEGHVDFSRAAWHGGITGREMGSRWCAAYLTPPAPVR
jgi:carnitine O-acetyltransferase